MLLRMRSCLVPCLAALALAGCRDSKISTYRVAKDADTPPQTPPAAQTPANTNDLPPAARSLPADGTLPPGHPELPAGHPAIGGAAAPDANAMAGMPVATAGDQALVWTAPAGWTPKPTSAMRRGSYSVTGAEGAADLSISAFPGDVGGDLANVNRWRGQLGLPAVADLTGALQVIDSNGLQIRLFEGANNGTRMLGAIVPRAGETWFFKLTGPDALVAREKSAFVDFLHTIRTP